MCRGKQKCFYLCCINKYLITFRISTIISGLHLGGYHMRKISPVKQADSVCPDLTFLNKFSQNITCYHKRTELVTLTGISLYQSRIPANFLYDSSDKANRDQKYCSARVRCLHRINKMAEKKTKPFQWPRLR